MISRRVFSSKWRPLLFQQTRKFQSTDNGTVLNPSKRVFFSAGLFLLGGGIAGTLYYYTLKPSKNFNRGVEPQYFEEQTAMTSKTTSTYDSFYQKPTEVAVRIKDEIQMDEKAIRCHLKAIGFEGLEVNKIIQEKKIMKKDLKISEILDELIEQYNKSEKKIIKEGGNKIIKIKKHKTMAIEETTDDGPSVGRYLRGRYETSSILFGNLERGIKVITQFDVETKIVDQLMRDDIAHRLYTSMFALFAGSACVLAFRRQCRLRPDIFLSTASSGQRFGRIFSETVKSVSKGSVWSLPFFTMLYISAQPWHNQDHQIGYRDGYMELLPPTFFSKAVNRPRILICNSQLDHIVNEPNIMECATTISTFQSQSSCYTLTPLNPAPNPLSLFSSAFLCASAFAVAFPFTIFPASCVGGVILATLLCF